MNDYPIDLEKEKAAMQELLEIARTQKLTSEERMEYLDRAKRYDYYIGGLEFKYDEGKEDGLRQGREEGREEGLVQGREEGIAQGREEGLAQGREEGRAEGANEATIRIAKSLKESGIPTDVIAKNTGLSIEEIERL